jgi:acylphosphatase
MADTTIIRQRIIFKGRVQGVGFRYRARYAADGMGLTGWVQNEWDGSVIMEVQGRLDTINEMLRLLNHSSFIEIDDVDRMNIPVEEYESGFHVH